MARGPNRWAASFADVTVPVATYTGWALRANNQANDGCEGSGQWIPFAQTEAGRQTSQGVDPRKSIAERYKSLDQYVARVAHALNKMVKERVLLCEDYGTELARLKALGAAVGNLQPDPSGKPHLPSPPKACGGKNDDDDDDD